MVCGAGGCWRSHARGPAGLVWSDASRHRIVCVVRLVHAVAFPGFEGVSVGRGLDHYPDVDVQILDCDMRTGRATICVEIDGDRVMDGVQGYAERSE